MEMLQSYLDHDSGALFLVFVKTKNDGVALEDELWKKGYKVAALHGDKSQQAREAALAKFKACLHRSAHATGDTTGKMPGKASAPCPQPQRCQHGVRQLYAMPNPFSLVRGRRPA